MRTRVISTVLLCSIVAIGLTGCGGNGKNDEKPAGNSSEQGVLDGKTPGQVDDSQDKKLGQPAQTVGDGGTGVLQITPDTVVFTEQGGGETAANGTFAVVTMKVKAMTAVAADEPAPISGGGWKWMAADGEMIDTQVGNAFNVVMDKYNNSDPVQPGSWQWRSQVFDLTAAQAKGGTLVYIDGEEKAHRWKMPSGDEGPNVAEVKRQLKF